MCDKDVNWFELAQMGLNSGTPFKIVHLDFVSCLVCYVKMTFVK
jgi:hypothetical protein